MSYKPIIIVPGEPNSVFLEIFFKALRKKNYKSPIILVCSAKILSLQMKKLKFKKKINFLNQKSSINKKLNNKSINIIDIKFNQSRAFYKISNKSNSYIEECFKCAFKLLKKNVTHKFINGPISKKTFLNKKFLGMTEFISSKFKIKKSAMLIYNEHLSVCPITTHLPLKLVPNKITKKNICEKIFLINSFYKKNFKIKPKIAILGLNPHCESIRKFNEDEKILKPTVKYLKKLNLKTFGPFSADTFFMRDNRKKYNVVVGMYHDQVLTPLKTLYEYNAINITLGLPFFRITPDHGPNENMVGKNISDPSSLVKAISFLDNH